MVYRISRRLARRFSLLLVLVVVAGLLPPPAAQARPAEAPQAPLAAAPAYTLLPPTPAPVTAPALTHSALPSLTLDAIFTPNLAHVGDLLTLTIQVINQGDNPAENVGVRLPLPAGAVAVPAEQDGWSWQQPELKGHSQVSFTAQLRGGQEPPGGALLAQPEVRANDLPGGSRGWSAPWCRNLRRRQRGWPLRRGLPPCYAPATGRPTWRFRPPRLTSP